MVHIQHRHGFALSVHDRGEACDPGAALVGVDRRDGRLPLRQYPSQAGLDLRRQSVLFAHGFLAPAQLQRIQQANQLEEPVYTLTSFTGEDGRLAVTSRGQEPVGKEYRLPPEIQPSLRRVLTEGKPAITPIYSNERGTWVTGFAPIVNRKGKTVAVLNVDHRADAYLIALANLARKSVV